jgi:VWFA-related protein
MRVALTAVLLFVAAAWTAAQQPAVFRTSTSRVRVHVTVVNNGTPVPNLDVNNFDLRDNGVRQAVELATTSEHLQMSVLIDQSTSISPVTLTRLRDVGKMLGALLSPRDNVKLISFAEYPAKIPGSRQGDSLQGLLDRVERLPTSRTALWDSVVASSAELAGSAGTPYVAVLTDGCDNSSWLSAMTAGEWLGRLDVTVDLFWIGSSIAERLNLDMWTDVCYGPLRLEDATRPNGGRIFRTADNDLARDIGRRISELRSGYLLTYAPTGVRSDDGWHKIEVRLTNGAKGRVTARPTYFAGDTDRSHVLPSEKK